VTGGHPALPRSFVAPEMRAPLFAAPGAAAHACTCSCGVSETDELNARLVGPVEAELRPSGLAHFGGLSLDRAAAEYFLEAWAEGIVSAAPIAPRAAAHPSCISQPSMKARAVHSLSPCAGCLGAFRTAPHSPSKQRTDDPR
jgi:hypothetical protein